MTPSLEATNLVFVGNWNPAIFQPEWIVREVMGVDPGVTPVTLEFSPIAGMPPKTTLENVTFIATNSRLILHPNSLADEALNTCERYGRTILEKLSHTPIKGFGQNFTFATDAPSADIVATMPVQNVPDGAVPFIEGVNETAIAHALRLTGGGVLNFTRKLTTGNGSFEVKFNFHYVVESAGQARALLENTFVANYQRARTILTALGIEIVEEGNQDE